jgi:hypothetical protein
MMRPHGVSDCAWPKELVQGQCTGQRHAGGLAGCNAACRILASKTKGQSDI